MPPVEKERKATLRDWLADVLDEGEIPGLKWMNEADGVFWIAWRNGNNREWREEDDGLIHKAWAVHKGHFKQKDDGSWPDADYPKWKARFRCALARCQYIEEIKQDNKNEWKTFRILRNDRKLNECKLQPASQSTGHGQGRAELGGIGIQPPDPEIQPTYSTDEYMNITFPPNIPLLEIIGLKATPPSSIENRVATKQSYAEAFPTCGSETLGELPPEKLARYLENVMDSSLAHSIEIDCSNNQEMPDSLSLLSFKSEPGMNEMCLWLRYRSTIIGKYIINQPKGCRIYNPDQTNVPPLPPSQMNIDGSEAIPLQPPQRYLSENVNQHHCDDIMKLLEYMDNGTHIICDELGNIFVRRLSRCKIYYADSSMNPTEPEQLPRNEWIKVFDYGLFQHHLQQAKINSGKGPSVSVLLSLGGKWSLTKPINKMRISATVTNAKCWYDLRKFRQSKQQHPAKAVEDSSSLEISFENMTLGQRNETCPM